MSGFTISICAALFSIFSPVNAYAEVIVHDMIAVKGEEVMLTVETRGKLFRKGGEIVEVFVDGKSLGKNLSGGDGFAYKQFTPLKGGIHQITARSGKEEGKGLLHSFRKGVKILFVDVEGALREGKFSDRPKKGSLETIKKLSARFPILYLQTGLLNTKSIKTWLKKNGFEDLPVIPWKQGVIFHEIKDNGLEIKGIVGTQAVIESAKEYKPKAFSFEEVEGAEEVKDWKEIGERLK